MSKVELKCECCGKLYERQATHIKSGRQFCSKACRYGIGAKEYAELQRPCPVCGKPIIPRDGLRPSQVLKHATCSAECGRILSDRSRRKGDDTNCATCGKVFYAPPSSKARFCSRQCWMSEWHKEKRICPKCGQSFTYKNPSQTHCSSKCGAQTAVDRLRSEGYYPERVPLLCEVCGITFHLPPKTAVLRRYCSRKCKAEAQMGQVPAGALDYLQNKEPTSIERETYQALNEMGIEFERQRWVSRRYCVDAYIPKTRTVIECQGDFWHVNPKRYQNGPEHECQEGQQDRDQERREYLESLGLRVIYLWELDIKKVGARALLERLSLA